MINWLLAFIGLTVYFLIRYNGRRNKTKFSFKFWFKDNWVEFAVSVLATFALMIIFLDEGSSFDMDMILEKVPFIKSIAADKFASLAIGYINSWLFYTLFKLKK